MGIRGLQTFMTDRRKNGAIWERKNLTTELPNGRAVLDGSNLCRCLYSSNKQLQASCALGGSYPKYFEVVREFFTQLTRVHMVKPIVIFDGPKDDNPYSRSHRISTFESVLGYQGSRFSSTSSLPLPLMVKEVFIDALDGLVPPKDIHFVDGKADAEIVAIANHFRCPVISDDSDFYIYNITGGYIPLFDNVLKGGRCCPSPEVCVFSTSCFTTHFGLQDEDLRFLIPAIVSNGHQLEPQSSEKQQTIQSILSYAQQFPSFEACIEKLRIDVDSPAVPRDCKAALREYTAPTDLSPSYLRDSEPLETELFKVLGEFCLGQFRTGHFQTFMVEAIMYGKTIFRPIFDDFEQASSQEVGLPIREEIYNILECITVTEIRRSGATCKLQDYQVRVRQPPIKVQRSLKKRKSRFCSVLQCHRQCIDRLPDEWRLPVASAVFWQREGQCSEVIVKALIACFVACYDWSPHIDVVPECRAPTQGTPALKVVHHLAQWQCIYFDALALNQLMGTPFQGTTVAKLFDAKLALSYALDPRNIERKLRDQGCDISLYRNLLDTVNTNLEANAHSTCPQETV